MPHYIAAEPTFSTGLRPEGIEKSPYFWWWRFLGLNDQYIETCERVGNGPLAALYKDFGDVRMQGDNPHRSFKTWWGAAGEHHGRLFQERSLFPKAKVLTAQEDWEKEMGEYPYAVVVVDVHLGVKKAQEMVGAAIKQIKHFKQLPRKNLAIENDEIVQAGGEFGSPEGRAPLTRRYSTAKYRLTAMVEKGELKMAYQVFSAVRDAGLNTVDKMSNEDKVRIAEFCGLLSKERRQKGLTRSERLQSYDFASKQLKKYFDDASRYIRNTGYGYFPEMPPAVISRWDNHTEALSKMASRNLDYM